MTVGPRYNDSDPAAERAAEAHEDERYECGMPEGCCMHRDRDEHGCWDCRNTGHNHEIDTATDPEEHRP